MTSVASDNQDEGRVGLGLGGPIERNTSRFGKNMPASYPRNIPPPSSQTQELLHIPDAPQGIDKPSSNLPASSGTTTYEEQRDYLVDEFGVDRSGERGQLNSKGVSAPKTQEPERNSSSGSTSSVVAAMRSRYANAVCFVFFQPHIILIIHY
jgi:hypothetical protein